MLHNLIRAKGLRTGQYALFFVSGEGEFLPISSAEQPVEETSGFVIDHAGRIFSFWMHWDYDDFPSERSVVARLHPDHHLQLQAVEGRIRVRPINSAEAWLFVAVPNATIGPSGSLAACRRERPWRYFGRSWPRKWGSCSLLPPRNGHPRAGLLAEVGLSDRLLVRGSIWMWV